MNKGWFILIIGVVALLAGAVIAALLIRKRLAIDEIDFDDFDVAVDDEEFEHSFGDEEREAIATDQA